MACMVEKKVVICNKMVVKEEARHKMERQRQRLEHEEQRARREAEENRWTDQEHIALIYFCIILLSN